MKNTNARSWASKLVDRFQSDGCVRRSVLRLTADEEDLLQPPPLAAYEPWIVALTVRPNDGLAEETADEQGAA